MSQFPKTQADTFIKQLTCEDHMIKILVFRLPRILLTCRLEAVGIEPLTFVIVLYKLKVF